MESKIARLFAALFLIAIALSAVPVRAPPIPYLRFYTTPSTITLNTAVNTVGERFNITVWIYAAEPIYTWQCKVTFNVSQLNVVRADYTGVGKSLFFTGHPYVPVTPAIDNTNGYVIDGESLVGNDSGVAGSNSLFWIEFQVIGAPPVGEALTSTIIRSTDEDTFMLDSNLNSLTLDPPEGTAYSYTWTTPGPVYFQVGSGTADIFGFPPPTGVVGTTFVDDVVIKNVNEGWYLGNATTHIAYNSTLLAVTAVTFDPIWGTTSFANNLGDLFLQVNDPTSNPSGDVVVAHVTFQILYQGTCPPRPFPPAPGSSDDTLLDLNAYTVFSTYDVPVTTTEAVDGYVRIYASMSFIHTYLSVSSATVGPSPSVGTLFNVTVTLNSLSEYLNMVGIAFRLQYPANLIEPVTVYEGPFMPYWASQQPESLGTFFISYFETDGLWGENILFGEMIYPDSHGMWHEPMTKGTGDIATITFRVTYQSFGEQNLSAPLHIVDQMAIGLDNMQSQNIVEIPMLSPLDGLYTITTVLPGRVIDLFGGAVNSGYGAETCHAFPAPYGGQGPNMPMDLVEEQSWVCLHANVTYNYWPVQHKLVGFQVNYPDGTLYANLFAFTDENGEAIVGFRMPWPCERPEELFGVWQVIAGVQVADVYMNDSMSFHYDYLVNIFKVTTDKYEYNHTEFVEVCVTYGSHAQQFYPILLKVHITDELGVVIGHFEVQATVGGTQFCQYKNSTYCGSIWIPKWAYAGIATVHVNIFDQEPIFGGAPWTPEYTGPTIAIQPY